MTSKVNLRNGITRKGFLAGFGASAMAKWGAAAEPVADWRPAERWRGFNLPTRHTAGKNYLPLCRKLIDAIRKEDPARFIMADGNYCAGAPVPELYKVPSVGQAFRGYTPMAITHYGTDYIRGIPKAPPTWPLAPKYAPGGLSASPESTVSNYQRVLDAGECCMVGEFGCNNGTPHATALAWMEHCLKLWKSKNIGWALWNLRGRFGIMDSGRKDVAYEDFNGHKLDRKMLELLRRY